MLKKANLFVFRHQKCKENLKLDLGCATFSLRCVKLYEYTASSATVFAIIVFVAYLVMRAFSAVIMLLDNKRNRHDIVKRGDLRCFSKK